MSSLSPRLQVRLQQKQTLTPGLVQMVNLLQLNRLELKEMISAEVAENPVLEEGLEGGEELTPEELQPLLEAEAERTGEPADKSILEATTGPVEPAEMDAQPSSQPISPARRRLQPVIPQPCWKSRKPRQPIRSMKSIWATTSTITWTPVSRRSCHSENIEKALPFETFAFFAPITLSDHLRSQLALVAMSESVRDAAEEIIGNLDGNGYLTATLQEIVDEGGQPLADVEEALRIVHTLDPAGVGATDVRECLLLQIESRNGKGGVAWNIVADHLKMVESRQFKELAKVLHRPLEHIQVAMDVIRHLDPRPGLRYSGPGARQVEPDVYISKDGEDYLIQLNDEDVPNLRLNPQYRRMLDRSQEPNKDVRNYVRDRYASAIQLIKNIEQRKHTILKVCQSIVRRQAEFLELGIDFLRPMMIKEIAEEIGVHPSTVSRAVSSKYAHTPQGVFELRYFFSEAVQGPGGTATPLLILKRKVKKMIEEEDTARPLTDEQITDLLQTEGIQVTRRTVAKYREDMRIPSTHQRRVRE